MRIHEYDLRNKTVRRSWSNKRRQQHLVWLAKKFLIATAASSNVELTIGQDIRISKHSLQIHSDQSTAFANAQETTSKRCAKENIPLTKLP